MNEVPRDPIARHLFQELIEADVKLALIQNRLAQMNEDLIYWKNKAQSNWDLVETIATGEKLQCAKCGGYHPCRCDDGQ